MSKQYRLPCTEADLKWLHTILCHEVAKSFDFANPGYEDELKDRAARWNFKAIAEERNNSYNAPKGVSVTESSLRFDLENNNIEPIEIELNQKIEGENK